MTLLLANCRDGHRRTEIEKVARASIESRTDRSLTDLEWAQARARLLEFVTILRAWEQKARTRESEFDKVA